MWFRRKKAEAQLSAELQYHFDRLVREAIECGVEPQEARRRARLEFGGIQQIEEECRDVRGRWLEDFGKDVRHAARSLRRSPGFLIVSVLSLALGIGANTAIFSLIEALMLRSLPVRDAARLVHITRVEDNGYPQAVSYPLFEHLRDNLKSISGAAVETEIDPVIVVDGAEEVVNAELVSGAQFVVVGVAPAAGRLLKPADDTIFAASPAAVISYRYWQRRFGGNRAAIGKTIRLPVQRKLFNIVGVTPPEYHGARLGGDPDITLPLTMMLSDEDRSGPNNCFLDMMGRLAPGATRETANAELQVVWRAFRQRVADAVPERDRPVILREQAAVLNGGNGFDRFRYEYGRALLVLMGIVALVLLLACANLTGLLLARAVAREREISIRLAIGASGGRLIRQFLTESFVLALLGGGAGLMLAAWLSNALIGAMAGGQEFKLSTAPDWRVLLFTSFVCLLACVLAAAAPGLHALRVNLNPGMKQARAGGHSRLGRLLVLAQVAISMVLVTGAVLFAATLAKLYSVDRGLHTDGILIVDLRTNGQCPVSRCAAAARTLLDRLNTLPGVSSASTVDVLPISGSLWARDVDVEGYTFRFGEDQEAAFNAVSPRYFATVGTPILTGREFDARDTSTSTKVTVVNESFARRFFGGRGALGKHVSAAKVTYEIVAVVKDAKYTNLRQGPLTTMYIPWTQRLGEEPTDFHFLAKVTRGNPMYLAPTVEKLVREVDPGLRVRSAFAYSTIIDRTIVRERIMAGLGGFFGILALLVACLGIFGMTAFQVSRRVSEIGLRMALGAGQGSILVLVMRDVAGTLAGGCLAGIAVAVSLAGLTREMLFGVTPADPAVFAAAAALLALAALAAAWVPARRAAHVDPMVALRHE